MDEPVNKQHQEAPQETKPALSKEAEHPHQTDLNAGTSDPTDGREKYDWLSGYPAEARVEIRLELAYLSFLLLASHVLIFSTWMGWLNSTIPVPTDMVFTFKKYFYYASSGLLGGVAFGVKYFYRTIGRGYWHQDRRVWRIMSPFLSLTVALVVGAMIDTSLISPRVNASGAGCLVVGFLSGYFADNAIGKMQEVAMVLFGKNASQQTSPHDK